MGIEGNDRADEIAKEATELEPATETTTIAKHLHNYMKEWKPSGPVNGGTNQQQGDMP